VNDKKLGDPHAKAPHDPIDVFRSELARRAALRTLFIESGLTQGEIDAINYAIKGARGLETVLSRNDKRALNLLMAKSPNWFECLLRDPAKASPELRAALAQIASSIP
jgi:hypothetical protein